MRSCLGILLLLCILYYAPILSTAPSTATQLSTESNRTSTNTTTSLKDKILPPPSPPDNQVKYKLPVWLQALIGVLVFAQFLFIGMYIAKRMRRGDKKRKTGAKHVGDHDTRSSTLSTDSLGNVPVGHVKMTPIRHGPLERSTSASKTDTIPTSRIMVAPEGSKMVVGQTDSGEGEANGFARRMSKPLKVVSRWATRPAERTPQSNEIQFAPSYDIHEVTNNDENRAATPSARNDFHY